MTRQRGPVRPRTETMSIATDEQDGSGPIDPPDRFALMLVEQLGIVGALRWVEQLDVELRGAHT